MPAKIADELPPPYAAPPASTHPQSQQNEQAPLHIEAFRIEKDPGRNVEQEGHYLGSLRMMSRRRAMCCFLPPLLGCLCALVYILVFYTILRHGDKED